MKAAHQTRQPSAVEIRKAGAADAAAIAAIHVHSWIATYGGAPSNRGIDSDIAHRTDLWKLRLRKQGTAPQISVAVSNAAVVGFIYFGPSPDADHDPTTTGQVLSLHVDPDLTNRGIGRRLIQHALDGFRGAGCASATLWVVAENRRSRGFYERLGWRPDGSRRREKLAVEGEEGDDVEVVRYLLELGSQVRERR